MPKKKESEISVEIGRFFRGTATGPVAILALILLSIASLLASWFHLETLTHFLGKLIGVL